MRVSSLLCVLAVFVLGGLSTAGVAVAGPYDEDPTNVYDPPLDTATLEPAKPPKKGGGASTMSYSAERYVVNPQDNAPWSSVRNRPNAFFIGSAADGTIFDVVRKEVSVGGNAWHYLGTVFQSPQAFCGFITAENLGNPNQAGSSLCPGSWDLAPSAFSQYVNCETCNGGWAVSLQHEVTYQRNVYPWAPNWPVDHASITRPQGTQVHWRYVTEDGRYVAVSDNSVSHLKWFFVPKSALPSICGYGANAKNPTTPERADWGKVCKSAAEGG